MKAFLCAALAVGDCLIFSNFSNLPFDTSVGLRDFYGSRADSAGGWKRVLAGELLMPVAPPRQSSPVHISFGKGDPWPIRRFRFDPKATVSRMTRCATFELMHRSIIRQII